MPDIFIDGENVHFSGPAPTTVEALLQAVDSILAPAGRIVARLETDGNSGAELPGPEAYTRAARVDIATVLLKDALAQVAATCAEAARGVAADADALANDVLRVAWDDVAPRCIALGQRLGGLLGDLGGLAAHLADAAVAESANQLGTAVESWIDSVQNRDAAEVTLRLDRGVIPALRRVIDAARALAGTEPA